MDKKLYGYYSVGDKVFFKKIQALLFASELLKSPKIDPYRNLITPDQLIKWHFNDEAFDTYDWTKEPEQSLDYLYYERARYLRQKYDYIVVYYSGGCDSHNMVMAFLEQNLKIDEIVVHHVETGIKILNQYNIDPKDPKIQPHTETVLQIFPRLKEIQILDPNIKINLFDTTQHTINIFSKFQSGDWILNVREELNPVDSAKYNFTSFDHFKKMIDGNNRVGILIGLDKPGIKIKNNQVYMTFADRRFNLNLFYAEIQNYSNAQVEFFYTSPDACALISKQAHTLKNWIVSSPVNREMVSIHRFQSLAVAANAKQFLEENARLLLYPRTWNKEWFQAKKGLLDWHAEADIWFHLLCPPNTVQGSCWRDGIGYVKNNIDSYFFYENDGFIEFTKEYILTNLEDY